MKKMLVIAALAIATISASAKGTLVISIEDYLIYNELNEIEIINDYFVVINGDTLECLDLSRNYKECDAWLCMVPDDADPAGRFVLVQKMKDIVKFAKETGKKYEIEYIESDEE